MVLLMTGFIPFSGIGNGYIHRWLHFDLSLRKLFYHLFLSSLAAYASNPNPKGKHHSFDNQADEESANHCIEISACVSEHLFLTFTSSRSQWITDSSATSHIVHGPKRK